MGKLYRTESSQIKSRNPDGSQNREYYTRYYRENRERITQLNKVRYNRVRSDPEQLKLHRERSTEATRRYSKRHPERVKPARREQYLSRKIRAMETVGGAICNRCGCDELDYLEFNHKNGGGAKEFRENSKIKGYLGMTDQLLTGKRIGNDIEILCRVCNALEFLERKSDKSKGRFTIIWK